MATKRNVTGGLQVGVGLISFSVLILGVFVALAASFGPTLEVRLVIVILGIALVGVLWVAAVRNGRAEKAFRARLQEQHPASLVERVRIWMLPQGKPEKGTPATFIVADAGEITFQDLDELVLLRIPVADIGFIGPVRAQGDDAKDKAVTIIYGDDNLTVQFFTITHASLEKLEARIRTAIGWPAEDAPGATA